MILLYHVIWVIRINQWTSRELSRDTFLLESQYNGWFLFHCGSEEHLSDVGIIGNHSRIERHWYIHRFLNLEKSSSVPISEVQAFVRYFFSSFAFGCLRFPGFVLAHRRAFFVEPFGDHRVRWIWIMNEKVIVVHYQWPMPTMRSSMAKIAHPAWSSNLELSSVAEEYCRDRFPRWATMANENEDQRWIHRLVLREFDQQWLEIKRRGMDLSASSTRRTARCLIVLAVFLLLQRRLS